MKKQISFCLFVLIFCFPLFSCTASSTSSNEINTVGGSSARPTVISNAIQFSAIPEGATIATLSTDRGDITLVLYPEYAGRAVDNFIRLAQSNYYNNTFFHRVVNNFIIQGGDPTATGEGGQSIWNKPFPIEINNALKHYSGAVCMAKDNETGLISGSQFYIVATHSGEFDESMLSNFLSQGMSQEVADTYSQAGGAPYLDNTDTVFGQVISGMDIVDQIASMKTDDDNVPKKEITLLSVSISQYSQREDSSQAIEKPASTDSSSS